MSDVRLIEIDFEVHKRIELSRASFSDTPNAVLRRLLGIDGGASPATSDTGEHCRAWSGKGVSLQHGTLIEMEYNGRTHRGRILNGSWNVEGQNFSSPSSAASGVATTKSGNRTSLDGWLYWRFQAPGSDRWQRLTDARSATTIVGPTSRSMHEDAKMGVTRPAGNDLPTEGQVIAELENYLAQRGRPVRLSEAYRGVADAFGLSPEQRSRPMENSGEIHWENRMRQARRKLKDAGKLDENQPAGLWALKRHEGSA